MRTCKQPTLYFYLIVAAIFIGMNVNFFSHGQADDSFDASFDQQTKQAFLLQGEYVGKIKTADNYQPVGLQLVSRGGNKYVAMLYVGGLPGNGWDRQSRSGWQGTNRAGLLELTAAEPDGRLIRQRAPDEQRFEVLDSGGLTIGTLDKVRRTSPTLNLAAPINATILFNGTINDDTLKDAKINARGNLDVGFLTSFPVEDFSMHVEFRTPFMPTKEGQQRGNSGIYIQRRYEVQILDSFGLAGEANECGGLYRQRAPDLNMCLPPGQWQTYDIDFQAARFDAEGQKTDKARISVRLNGVKVHDDVAIETKTGAGQSEGPDPLPILFQNHNDPVEFRNIWLVATKQKPELAASDPAPPTLTVGCQLGCPAYCCPTTIACCETAPSCTMGAPRGAVRHSCAKRNLACTGGLRQRIKALACRR